MLLYTKFIKVLFSLSLAILFGTCFVLPEVAAEDHGAPAKHGTDVKKGTHVVKKRRKRIPKKTHVKEEALHVPAKAGSADLDSDTLISDSKTVQTVLLLDSSRSMKKTDPKRLRDQGARLFLQFLEPNDSFAIIDFAEDAKIAFPMTPMRRITSTQVQERLETIENEGNFTDFLPALDLASLVFEENKDAGAERVIILLTDGQLDPNPKKGNKEEINRQILEERIPLFKKKGTRVFTLALSELADQDLLKKIAHGTNGDAWHTDQVNEVHRIFSDLFLTIKKPQVLELDAGGFEIDNTTGEATFFINRKSEDQSITLLDPVGNEYRNKNFPSNWKWFRGPLFDVITIPNPLPGLWGLKGGVDDITGFAKLLTQLNLEYSWPEGMLSVGDTALIKVRLTESGKAFDPGDLRDLLFFTFKIVDIKSGQVYLRGKLNDDGKVGDESASDGVFSDTITMNAEGDYKLFVGVTAPTFSRQVHIPFTVGRGLILLTHVPKNEFTGTADKYIAILNGEAKDLSKRKVVLVVRSGDHGSSKEPVPPKTYLLKERHSETGDPEFLIPTELLPPGKHLIYVAVKGLNRDKKEVVAKSEEVEVVIKNHAQTHAVSHDDEIGVSHGELQSDTNGTQDEVDMLLDDPELILNGIEDDGVDEDLSEKGINFYGLIGTLLTLIYTGFFVRFFLKKSRADGGIVVSVRDEYQMPEELRAKLDIIYAKASETKLRFLRVEEIAMFSAIPEIAAAQVGASGEGGIDDVQAEDSSDISAENETDSPESEEGQVVEATSDDTSSDEPPVQSKEIGAESSGESEEPSGGDPEETVGEAEEGVDAVDAVDAVDEEGVEDEEVS